MKHSLMKFARRTLCSAVLIGLQAGWTGMVRAEDGEVHKSALSQQQMAELRARFSTARNNVAVQKAPVAEVKPARVPVVESVAAPMPTLVPAPVPAPVATVVSTPVPEAVAKPVPVPAPVARSAPVLNPLPATAEPTLPGPSLRTLVRNAEAPVSDELRSLLRTMVGKALAHSPEVRVAKANESAAGYDIDEVKGRRWPQVSLGLSSALTRQQQSPSSRSASGDTSGSFSVTTTVWDWGKNAGELHTAKAALGSAEQTGLVEREQVAFDTSSELINLMRYEQSMTVADDYVQQMSSRVDMLLKISQSDKGRTSELVQARAKLLSAQASRKQIENQQQVTRIKLRRLLGEEVPTVPERLAVVGAPMIDPAVALAALDKNPLLLRLKEQAEMEDGRAQVATAQGLPGLNLVASKQQNGLSGTNNDPNYNNDWYVGFDVQWQAFSGGSNRAARRAANARKDAALEQYQKADQDLRQEINRLVQSRASAVQLAVEYQRLSQETDRVRKMFYQQWYNLGKRTLLDVLVAENDHFNSQLQAINNTCDSLIADLSILSNSALLVGYLSL